LVGALFVPLQQMPGWWVWYYFLDPVSWTLYGLIASQLGDVKTLMQLNDGSAIPVSTRERL
jgi:hypothetical protein